MGSKHPSPMQVRGQALGAAAPSGGPKSGESAAFAPPDKGRVDSPVGRWLLRYLSEAEGSSLL